tara:strand:- start:2304 stop:2756 length:453 start_codon:yes stop_codon:yes gene_type:complete
MIEVGALTVMVNNGKRNTYRCLKIENGVAHLKNILHEQGRPTKIPVKECPYMEDGKLIVPEKVVEKRPRTRSKLNLTSILKDNTDLQISRTAKNFLYEWAETAIANMITNAEQNALERGDARISAAHIHWLETNERVAGYWKEHEQYIKD